MTRFPLLAALGTSLLLAACAEEIAAPPSPPRLVQLAEVVADSGETRHEFVGRVEARLNVDMAFQVGGQLAELPLNEGVLIEQGTLVAALDREDFQRAEREARVQLQQANTELERQRTLHERGIASQAALDSAQTNYDLREVALQTARRNLGYATLTAPFDALVSRRLVDNYTIVSPGQPVVRLMDVSELRVSIPISESMVATFDRDSLVSLEAAFAFLPGQTFALEPRELVSEPDAASRTYRAIAALPADMPANILPGMTATVYAEFASNGASVSGLRVPLPAVTAAPDGGQRVWVFNAESGVVNARAITSDGYDGDMIIVTSGIAAGDRVVTAGVNALHEGMPVRPLSDSTRFGQPQ
ncbi:efflux transporter periplasmic adaptor subunit [Maricaulis sp. W15]|uniref:RND family efflux transporter MFP subunit n=1 Tax=Maricaulis maris TaxID=74318 RepID=A0A495DEJ6_9PROT|nr:MULTISPECIES: efflux RND transporter periplasmic adaptor subunit [Maricaulis]OLF73898.1 efflux transporter periplasmic adaptor subunit [Maricaulis sp. W15]RKR00325.1 RND family efflux transporter MFP subunit [Maricaulis maris]